MTQNGAVVKQMVEPDTPLPDWLAHEAVHFVSLLKEKIGQIGAVLTRDSSDESLHCFFSRHDERRPLGPRRRRGSQLLDVGFHHEFDQIDKSGLGLPAEPLAGLTAVAD